MLISGGKEMEIHINKDVGNYEAKVVGPFTLRQAVCIAVAAPVCVWLYNGTSSFMPSDAAGFLTFIPAVIAWLFGWKKPYGMPMEKFLKSIFVTMVLAPSNRKYKTVNRHEKALSIVEAEMLHEQKASSHKAEKKQKYKRSQDGIA